MAFLLLHNYTDFIYIKMKKCLGCGVELGEGVKFCAQCGTEAENDGIKSTLEFTESHKKQLEKEVKKKTFLQRFIYDPISVDIENFKKFLDHKGRNNREVEYNYGFSYVQLFKLVNGIVSFASVCVLTVLLSWNAQELPDVLRVFVFVLPLGLIIYYVLNIGIKLFENVAIISKMSVEIRNKLYEKKDD